MTDNTTFDDLFDHQNEEQQRPRKKKRVWRKVLVALLIIVILGVLGIGLYVWSVGRSFDKNANQLSDEQVFGKDSAGGKEGDGTNILLLGSDESMSDVDVNDSRGLRSDTIMVMHLPEDGGNVQIMSIPRDTYVDIGATASRRSTRHCLRRSALAVSTVSDFIGTELDHVAIIDFEGFKA